MVVTSTDLKNTFGKYLQICLSNNEEVIISKNGNEVAKMVPIIKDDKNTIVVDETKINQ